jgi:hypothetical protein
LLFVSWVCKSGFAVSADLDEMVQETNKAIWALTGSPEVSILKMKPMSAQKSQSLLFARFRRGFSSLKADWVADS